MGHPSDDIYGRTPENFGTVAHHGDPELKKSLEMADVKNVLNPPQVKRVRYKTNFIRTAVCEVRFPTLLELETTPPRDFQTKIRRDYPFYEAQSIQVLGQPEDQAAAHQYAFKSKDKNWTVALRSFSLALETKRYVDFGDFLSRLTTVLANAAQMIDSNFFTRVGLRYVNAIPITDNDLKGWVQEDLVRPVTDGILGDPTSFLSSIQGNLDDGQYTFRHGFSKGQNDAESDLLYSLDFDYFKENVELSDIEALIRKFNDINFAFFTWCLGEKAKDTLGEGEPK